PPGELPRRYGRYADRDLVGNRDGRRNRAARLGAAGQDADGQWDRGGPNHDDRRAAFRQRRRARTRCRDRAGPRTDQRDRDQCPLPSRPGAPGGRYDGPRSAQPAAAPGSGTLIEKKGGLSLFSRPSPGPRGAEPLLPPVFAGITGRRRGRMADTAEGARFDVAAFIDERPIGWREITTLVVVSIVLFIDGFDMYFFGKMLPAIADGLGVEPAAMTGVVFWQQVGMFAGAIVMPPLADRIGRRPVLGLGLLTFGVLTLWAAWSTSPAMMAWLRGISGIFFSAMLPVALALLAEMTPRRRRASFISIALVCFSGANIASGAITAWALDIYGWQIGFWLGGALPLIAFPLLLLLPESLTFRVT